MEWRVGEAKREVRVSVVAKGDITSCEVICDLAVW